MVYGAWMRALIMYSLETIVERESGDLPHNPVLVECVAGPGHYKTWTVDYGLDCGLDHGLGCEMSCLTTI